MSDLTGAKAVEPRMSAATNRLGGQQEGVRVDAVGRVERHVVVEFPGLVKVGHRVNGVRRHSLRFAPQRRANAGCRERAAAAPQILVCRAAEARRGYRQSADGGSAHRARVGDIVAVEEQIAKKKASKDKNTTQPELISGVVYRLTKTKITVIFKDDLPDIFQSEPRIRLCKLANDVSFDRMRLAMRDLAASDINDTLMAVLLGSKVPSFDDVADFKGLQYFDEGLNDSQREAVCFSLAARELALVHGPPGTGKTYTCVEIIRQLVKAGKRVLVCGPSNISVDNLVERLAKTKISLVRLGHPARILDSVLMYSLEVRVRSSDEGQLFNDVRSDLDNALQSIQKAKSKMQKRELYQEVKLLRKELKQREQSVTANIIKNSKVVLSTLNGTGSRLLAHEQFDVVLIDEATQSLEPECWIAMLKAKKVILAGDHLQLPYCKTIEPTVKSSTNYLDISKLKSLKISDKPSHRSEYKPKTLEFTLFDRMLQCYGNT
ncbi:hypothetical protein HK096_005168, partial [Nowakowskiella sp. JEL0078]